MRRLIDSLAALHERLVSLAQIASAKLVALRAADVATLESLSATEVAELESLRSCDADREAILAGLAQHLPGLPGPLPKLAALADRLPEPLASQLRAKNEGLRAAARKLEEKNRLVADVARGLHAHVRGVFADLAGANQETVVYGRTGRHDPRVTRSWVDAVG
jgi:hypothetical protein